MGLLEEYLKNTWGMAYYYERVGMVNRYEL